MSEVKVSVLLKQIMNDIPNASKMPTWHFAVSDVSIALYWLVSHNINPAESHLLGSRGSLSPPKCLTGTHLSLPALKIDMPFLTAFIALENIPFRTPPVASSNDTSEGKPMPAKQVRTSFSLWNNLPTPTKKNSRCKISTKILFPFQLGLSDSNSYQKFCRSL